MKLINILLVTAMLLMLATGSTPELARAQMDQDRGSEVQSNIGLRIHLDINPTSWSGSILFERGTLQGDSHRSYHVNVVDVQDEEQPSLARSIQDRFRAVRILTRVAAHLLEKALLTLL